MSLMLLLTGCLTITSQDFDELTDADGDGFISVAVGGDDCDDLEAATYPGAPDTWYDGVDSNCDGRSDFDQDRDGLDDVAHGGTDCDDRDYRVLDVDEIWVPDCDGDGSPLEQSVESCGVPDENPCPGEPRWLHPGASSWDCDDSDSSISPTAADPPYDGVDSNCDGGNDYDADGDGYIDAAYDTSYTEPGGLSTGDCDDGAAAVYPGALDVSYDGIDADCDGADDYDFDGDGFRAAQFAASPELEDCNDLDPTVFPGAHEVVYDGTDQNCVAADDNDLDGDGFAAAAFGGTDCNDEDPAIHPAAVEVSYNGIDDDCDPSTLDADLDGDGVSAPHDCDDLDPEIFPGAVDIFYDGVDSDCAGDNDYDADGDGFVRAIDAAFAGHLQVGDCDDSSGSIHPGAPDAWYDGLDEDCAGNHDYDADADGAVPPAYAVFANGLEIGDCNDNDPAFHPEALDTWYDGIDHDCDGANDYDADRDTWVDCSTPASCDARTGGTAPNGPDCDDTRDWVRPFADDAWYDGIDANCDGMNDFDQDGDGWAHDGFAVPGDPTAPIGVPPLPASDCDDEDSSVSPDATDAWYDGIDTNCDAVNDYDQDGDGFLLESYVLGAGLPLSQIDCNELDPTIHPFTVETYYDGVDQDCLADDDYDQDRDGVPAYDPLTPHLVIDCNDEDETIHPAYGHIPAADDPNFDGIDQDCAGDGFDGDGDGFDAVELGGTDCDDSDPSIRPNAAETYYDGVDQNCDQRNDWDRDGDGYVRLGDAIHAGGTAPFTEDCDDDDAAHWLLPFLEPGDEIQEFVDHACTRGFAGDHPITDHLLFSWDTELHLEGGVYQLEEPLTISDTVVLEGDPDNPARIVGAGDHRLIQGLDEYSGVDTIHVELVGGSTTGNGGCIYLPQYQSNGRALEYRTLSVYDTHFENCSAGGEGGAIFALDQGVRIIDSSFVNNQATRGGAISTRQGTTVILRTSFEGNWASNVGGAIALERESESGQIGALLLDNTFSGDAAGSRGGGIYSSEYIVDSSGGRYVGLTFEGTSAPEGAALYFDNHDAGSNTELILADIDVLGAVAENHDGSLGSSLIHLQNPNTFFGNNSLELTDLHIVGGRASRAIQLAGVSGFNGVKLENVTVERVTGEVGIEVTSGVHTTLRGVRVSGGISEGIPVAGIRLTGPSTLDHVTVNHNDAPAQVELGTTTISHAVFATNGGEATVLNGAATVSESLLVQSDAGAPAGFTPTTSDIFVASFPYVGGVLDSAHADVSAHSELPGFEAAPAAVVGGSCPPSSCVCYINNSPRPPDCPGH